MMWQAIFTHLTNKGLSPHAPGQHKGECKSNFCIVREGTCIPSFLTNKLGQQIIDIILFVPVNSYIAMAPYAKDIREALQELKYLRKTGTETPIIPDDEKKAYTMSIEYVIQKKLEV